MSDDNPQADSSLPASQASQLLTSFTTFLTLTIHSLLYHRALYPPQTFLTARAYNLPVRQSRHPGVCTWVNDAVSAVAAQLQRASLSRVVFVVHAPKSFRVVERWVFDVGEFPEWGSVTKDDAETGEDIVIDEELRQEEVNWTDVNEALRGALRRVAYAAEKMPDLPEGCTFTLAAELRDEAPAPIGHPQEWIPSQPNLQKKRDQKQPGALQASTTPVRSVQAGPLFFECWIEQPKAEADTSKESSEERQNKDDNTSS